MAMKKLAPNLMVEDVNRTVEFYILDCNGYILTFAERA